MKKKPFRSGNNQFNIKWKLKSGASLGQSDLADLVSQMTDSELGVLQGAIRKEKNERGGGDSFGEPDGEDEDDNKD
jgi:hypothetical protein